MKLARTIITFAIFFAAGCGMQSSSSPNRIAPPTMVAPINDKACAQLPPDREGTMNLQAGWSRMASGPASMVAPPPCGDKIESFTCMSANGCQVIEYKTNAGQEQHGQTWNGIVDLFEGQVMACADQSAKFGYGSTECQWKTYIALGGVRIVLPVKVATQGSSSAISIFVKPAPGYNGQIVLGQIGFDRSPK